MLGTLCSTIGNLWKLTIPAIALLLAMVVAVPLTGTAEAQSPPGDEIVLVNDGRDLVDRKEGGGFVAHPVFNRQIDNLYYGVRDTDDGEWLTAVYAVLGGENRLSKGWEYSWKYSVVTGKADLDPEKANLLVMVADVEGGHTQALHAPIPGHWPKGLWDRVLRAFDPETWARAAATWVVGGPRDPVQRAGAGHGRRHRPVQGRELGVRETSSPSLPPTSSVPPAYPKGVRGTLSGR